FENDDSYIYIGNSGNFTDIGIALSTTGSQDATLEYYYCANDGTWKVLGGIVDTTGGFTISGTIHFPNPSDRGTCYTEYDGTNFTDTTNYTYIAIKRTRNFIVTTPIENLISISGATTLFTLEEDMIQFNCVASAPYVCGGAYKGAIYCDSATTELLWCDGATWQPFAETGDVTNHNALSGLQGGDAANRYHLLNTEYNELTAWLDNVVLLTGGNLTTDGWFNGLFNWSTSSSFLTWTGSLLTFDSDLLNATIYLLEDNSTYNATYLMNETG
ncbi:unnamed protein product, partial [marine sediment metagenome]